MNYDLDILGNSEKSNKDLGTNLQRSDPRKLNSMNNFNTQKHHNLVSTNDICTKDMKSNENVLIKEELDCTMIKIEPFLENEEYNKALHGNETGLMKNEMKDFLHDNDTINENYQETLHDYKTDITEKERKYSIQGNDTVMENESQRSLQSLTENVQHKVEKIEINVENTFDVNIDIKEELVDEVNDQIPEPLDKITKKKHRIFNTHEVKSESECIDNTTSADDLLIPNKVLIYREASPVEEYVDQFGAPSPKKCTTRINSSLSKNNMMEIAETSKTTHKPKYFIKRRNKTKDNKQTQKVQKQKHTLNNSICRTNDIESGENVSDSEKVLKPELSCNICIYRTWNKTYMDLHTLVHKQNKLEENRILSCTICDFVTEDKPSLTKHLIQHNGKTPFRCTLCNFRCEAPGILIKHSNNDHPEVTRPFSCNVCEYKSAHNSDIVRHTRTHTGEKPGEKLYSCELCEYRSKRNSAIVSHMRRHTGERPYKCKGCDFKFANNSDLVRHMKLNPNDNYSCNVCEFKCTAKCALIKHLRTHTEVSKYKCILCSLEFARNCYLLRHMRSHNGKDAYSCSDCEFTCDTYVKYTRHVSSHTGEKNFTCDICEYVCKGKHVLSRHMKIHTVEKHYSCTSCNFRCLRHCDLAAHMKTHPGDKSYSCAHCSYTCGSRRTLNRHVQKTHIGKSEAEFII